jgi:DNA-binding NtrC family response regulator
MTTEPNMILYIEDDEGTARLVRQYLERFGYMLEITDSAEQGLKKYNPNIHQMILMDYVLPGMNGLNALKKLAPNKYDPAIVMITAAGSEKVAVEAMNNGAAGYIMKSNSTGFIDLLPVAIESALAKRNLYRQNSELQARVAETEKELAKLGSEIGKLKLQDTALGRIYGRIQKKQISA